MQWPCTTKCYNHIRAVKIHTGLQKYFVYNLFSTDHSTIQVVRQFITFLVRHNLHDFIFVGHRYHITYKCLKNVFKHIFWCNEIELINYQSFCNLSLHS